MPSLPRLPGFRRAATPADARPAARPPDGDDEPTELERAARWFDERTGLSGILRASLRKVFPDHWSFLLGEIALFCFVILVATGTFLAFFFVPSSGETAYGGPYAPLVGQPVSEAFASVMRLSFEVRAGLLMRQVHHWTAVVFVAVVILHLSRVFFTGAFRRPREINWVLGFGLLTFAMAEGFTGYSLPDDLLSGTGARIAYSAAISIPLVGPYLASLVFGGEFPTAAFIPRFFVLHVMLLPAIFALTIGLHVGLVFIQKHTQFRGPIARPDNVVGRYFWPGQAFLSGGLFFLTAAVMALLGGLVQINPIWAYGPFQPAVVSSPAQPDWYVGWLDGALRIFPPIEPHILGVVIPSVFIPGVLVPGVLFTVVGLWPFLESWVTGDRREHNLLQYPWEAPWRAALGSAIVTFFAVLTLAGGNDVLAVFFNLEVYTLIWVFRVLAIVLPIAVGLVAYRLAMARLERPSPEAMTAEAVTGAPPGEHPRRGGIALRRTPDGGFEEVEP